MAVAEEWTDWAEPAVNTTSPGAILAFDPLLKLAALVYDLTQTGGVDE